MLLQSELTGLRLAEVIESMIDNQEKVRSMAQQSLALRKVNSAEATVRECTEMVASR